MTITTNNALHVFTKPNLEFRVYVNHLNIIIATDKYLNTWQGEDVTLLIQHLTKVGFEHKVYSTMGRMRNG